MYLQIPDQEHDSWRFLKSSITIKPSIAMPMCIPLNFLVHTLNFQNHFSLIKFITHLHVHLKQAILLLHVPLSFKICSYIFFNRIEM